SGSGKTSILNCISGINMPSNGKITFNHAQWFDSTLKINLAIENRELGFVFQNSVLFPHLNVLENLKFVCDIKKENKWFTYLSSLFNIQDLLSYKISALSGGQKQQIVLVRALLRQPQVLLLDEPFSAIDVRLRKSIQEAFLKVQKLKNITCLFVSHDLEEVIRISDSIFLIEKGKIIKSGKPENVFINENQAEIKFRGYVLAVEPTFLTILMNEQIFCLTTETKNYSKGDVIEVDANQLQTLRKV
ncbi:MAG: ATP-binding cassette domain-containing protein, partial [Flavobacteriia bacterium]|nr:ATP-binding cassette domain-containing protein [Flavobacteriia bacterium]